MHPLVERLPRPDPDYRRFLAVLRREQPDRVPLIELAVHPTVVDVLLDEPAPAGPADARRTAVRALRLHHRLGYDVMKISAPIPFRVDRLTAAPGADTARQWTDEHAGPIAELADVERYPWPRPADVDFGPVEAAAAALPDGMRLIGFSGGILEFAMDLLGMTRLLHATRKNPALVAAVLDRVGPIVASVFETYCQMDAVCAVWLGDDLGHKHGPLLSPAWLVAHVVPWYRRLADIAHAHGRPFLLHSCGQIAAVLPALVAAGIDAKHSFEDAIEPVEAFYDRWHERLAVLGGIDVHRLATHDAAAIRARTHAILAHTAAGGGYACGSGNSIPDYVPPPAYLAMVAAVHEFNGRA